MAFVVGCAPVGSYRQWGTMKEVLRQGNTEPRIELNRASLDETSYGVGALEGLAGEITIDGGTVWVSRTLASDRVETRRSHGERVFATMLFVAEVPEWREVEVKTDIGPADLDAFIGRSIGERGRSSDPMPFRIEGEFEDLRLHVIGGQCPMRARMLEQELTSPVFELTIPSTKATIVGIFAENAEGVISHLGSETHMHVIVEHEGGTITGHVEHVSVLVGSVLLVPAAN